MCKCWKDKCLVPFILVAECSIVVIKMGWSIYLFNEFIQYHVNSQRTDKSLSVARYVDCHGCVETTAWTRLQTPRKRKIPILEVFHNQLYHRQEEGEANQMFF